MTFPPLTGTANTGTKTVYGAVSTGTGAGYWGTESILTFGKGYTVAQGAVLTVPEGAKVYLPVVSGDSGIVVNGELVVAKGGTLIVPDALSAGGGTSIWQKFTGIGTVKIYGKLAQRALAEVTAASSTKGGINDGTVSDFIDDDAGETSADYIAYQPNGNGASGAKTINGKWRFGVASGASTYNGLGIENAIPLGTNYSVPSGSTLTVPVGSIVAVPNGSTLTVRGTLSLTGASAVRLEGATAKLVLVNGGRIDAVTADGDIDDVTTGRNTVQLTVAKTSVDGTTATNATVDGTTGAVTTAASGGTASAVVKVGKIKWTIIGTSPVNAQAGADADAAAIGSISAGGDTTLIITGT